MASLLRIATLARQPHVLVPIKAISSLSSCTRRHSTSAPPEPLSGYVERTADGVVDDDDDFLGMHESDDRFIPVTHSHLLERMQYEFSRTEADKAALSQLGILMKSVLHIRFNELMDELKMLYDVHDPDKDTVAYRNQNMTTAQREVNEALFLDKISLLVDKANFDELKLSELDMQTSSRQLRDGVKVTANMKRFRTLKIWVRGEMDTTTIKNWSQSLIDKFYEIKGVPAEPQKMYQRVIVACRTGGDQLYLKLYKDVCDHQLVHLLPQIKISMSALDKGVMTGSLLAATTTSLVHSWHFGASFSLGLSSLVVSTAALLALRTWRSIQNNKNKYLAQQMQTLYYQNMNNNRGLIALLVGDIDRSEDEEWKEAMLAFKFISVLGSPVRTQYLATRIEAWLFAQFRVRVCFDVHDALDKLRELNLIHQSGDVIFGACSTPEAIDILRNMRAKEFSDVLGGQDDYD